MKKILLLLFFPFTILAQESQYENQLELQSLKISELEKDLNHLRSQLNQHHIQYTTGFGLQVIGMAIMIIDPGEHGLLVGGAMALAGSCVIVSSDKFFGIRRTVRRHVDSNIPEYGDCGERPKKPKKPKELSISAHKNSEVYLNYINDLEMWRACFSPTGNLKRK